jgi:hypothetical protein
MKLYQLGLLFRLLGPLVELLSVLGLVQYRGQDVRYAGVPIQSLCWAGFGLGLILVVLGLGLTAFRPKARRRPPSFRLDLGEGSEPPLAFDDRPTTEP